MIDDTNIFATSEISRDRDIFLRELMSELASVLEDSVGLSEAEGFIALVGNRIGEMMNAEYLSAADTAKLDIHQVANALVDLKSRIDGGFSIESIDARRIVLVNTRCPFGRYVNGRYSLCMMTSSVFGRIAANNLGYARVELAQTISQGDPGCRVIVHLAEGGGGREYFG
ncbi:methanogen output domain 1-containing protein [Algicella marina]|uniref:Transcriptional regulator n=1 Tax=Algicella marina TaxID=2683284 RepID=A0A6P1SYB9_9RHOB|nr:methanogen output domain 1-containing protein [Algicella marina]QHQ34206.1 transcriptional regulator [Algicella marina]